MQMNWPLEKKKEGRKKSNEGGSTKMENSGKESSWTEEENSK